MLLKKLDFNRLVRANILKLTPYSSARGEFKGAASVFLDANENPFESGYNRYPDPLQLTLKDKISALWHVPVPSIFLGNGSDEPIDLLVRLFCEPGLDHIIITPPTYGMYRVAADIAGVEVKEINLRTDFQLSVKDIIEQANEHSKILFLCSPNNPTGNLLNKEDIIEVIHHFPGIVVLDEAYTDFAENASFLPELSNFPNLVILQTFSKAWGLAAIRLGMAFASMEIIDLLNKIKSPYNLNILTIDFVLRQLDFLKEKNDSVDILIKERHLLMEHFKSFSFINNVNRSDANFILIQVDDADGLYQFLVSRGIIVRNRSNMQLCKGGLRITVGTTLENNNLLASMSEWASLKSLS
ncbi:MAG: histidinol-phosphate transaminase [Bacteroidota bacterium]